MARCKPEQCKEEEEEEVQLLAGQWDVLWRGLLLSP